jgi:hypothetical protein
VFDVANAVEAMLMDMAARDEADVGAGEHLHESPTVVGRNIAVIHVPFAGMHMEERLVHEESDGPPASH